jgi:ATP-binding cassette subfamily B protein
LSDTRGRSRFFHLSWIWYVWKEKKGLIALLLFLTLLSSAVAVAFPLLTKRLFDSLQEILSGTVRVDDPAIAIRRTAWSFAALGLAGFIAGFFPGIRGALNVIFDYVVRKRYFSVLTEKDHRFFARFSSGDLVTRLTSDIAEGPKLAWFLCSGIFRAVESTSKVLFCIVAMFLLDARLALFSVLPLPFMLFIFARTQDRIYDKVKKNEEAVSRINEQLETSFSGARIIKAFNRETSYGRFFSEVLEQRFTTEMAVTRLDTILNLIYQNIDHVAQIGLVFAGGIAAVRGRITIGTFYAFYNYLNLLIFPILDIPQLFVSGKRAFVNIDRLEELADFPSAPPQKPECNRTTRFERLEFSGLSFAYKGRDKNALHDISFSIACGERILVVGAVGSGKSTLLKAAAGLLAPDSGSIFINGSPLPAFGQGTWTEMIGYVPQEALLFSGSIEENVALGAPGISGTSENIPQLSKERFRELMRIAQMEEEVRSLPEGGQSLVGQRGTSLSGGQKQRLAVARALARDPQLLLLDDMTASLDSENEERLWRLLEAKGTSILAVSHRLSSIQYVDKVLFLEEGCISAFGLHDELRASNTAYRNFIGASLTCPEGFR